MSVGWRLLIAHRGSGLRMRCSSSRRSHCSPVGLQASVESSRFHVQQSADINSDIELNGVDLSIGGRELLKDAHIELFAGVRYGLIGRNGSGKTLLLQSLAYRWLPGVPRDLPILYVDQLESDTELDTPLLQLLLQTNTESWTAWEQIERLSVALDTEDEEVMSTALLSVLKEDAAERVLEAERFAARSSGVRGAQARKKHLQLEKQLAAVGSPDESASVSVPVPVQVQQQLARLHATALEPRSVSEQRARDALRRSLVLGDEAVIDAPLRLLSAGSRMRVALAKVLYYEPSVLLLDEPTNHLDIPGILWLKKMLNSLPSHITVVLVSHDRDFLNSSVDEILVLQDRKLVAHAGNYDAFVQAQVEAKAHRHRQRQALQKKRAKAEDSVRKDHAAAKKKRDDKKLAQVASRRRKLDDRLGIEKNVKGHRFKLNRDRAGWHFGKRADVEEEFIEKHIVWHLLEPDRPLRTPAPLLVLDGVSFGYDSSGVDLQLRQVSLVVEQHARIAIVGANGEGKSTLMNLMAGNLQPLSGEVSAHPQARFAYFEQHFVERTRKLTVSLLEFIASEFPDETQQVAFNALGAFDLAELAHQPLNVMSGGQMVRFAFALMGLQRPHAVFLDEPTNHLDMQASEALLLCLKNFSGAVVLVSHDVYFIDAMQCSAVYDVRDGCIRDIDSVRKYQLPQDRASVP